MSQDHRQLLEVVRTVRNRWRLKLLLRGTALLVTTAAALALAAGYAIDASRFDAGAVAAVRVLAYLVLAAVVLRFVAWPLLRRVSDERVALYLEEHEPSLGGRVISAVGLARADGAHSAALAQRLVRSAVDECRQVDGGRRVERPALLRSSGWMAASTVFGLGLALLGPAFLGYTTPLLLDPWQAPAAVNPYRILVEPGDTVLARGADLAVTARLDGFDAADVELALRGGDGEWKRWSMLEDDAQYSLIVFDLDEPAEYFVEASGVGSPVFRVEVMELPYVEAVRLTYHFPAYTGLDPVEQSGSGDVAALVGTEVRLAVTPTFAVPGGVLEVDGKGTIPLAVNADGTLTGALTVGAEPGVYRVLLDSEKAGRRVTASPDYLIDPIVDQPPTLTIAKPGRDVRVTSLEEVVTEVRAQDDYGVRRLELVYSVNGGDERTETFYEGRPGRQDFAGTHTLYLEEFELVPGDLIAYWARAVDGYDGDEPHEAVSDIYFLEVRPFDRNYRQADQAGGGAMGMSGEELSAQQRLVIAATFKLARGRHAPEDDLTTVALAQGKLRAQVLELVARLTSQGLMPGGDSPVAAMVELLPRAAEEMAAAEEALGELRPADALAPEQRALRDLQRVEAAFRDLQVTRAQGGAGGGQGEINDELAELFELEMDRLRNQYEQVQRGERQRVDDALDATLERLRELARRQQQENERMRARARQAEHGARAGSSGQSQRQLAEEAEEVARRLERLARDESLPDLAETARRLREAAEAMRRAAAADERAGEALGSSALDQLRQARRQLERGKSGRLERDARRALEAAQSLRRQQESMVDRVERLDAADDAATREVMEAKVRMGAEVGDLEASLDRLSRESRRDQPEASRRLQEAAGAIRDEQIREKILYSRGVVEQRSKEYARNFEEHVASALGELEERVQAAIGAIGESREARLERALDETRDAVTALESLGERLRDASAGGSASLAPRQYRRELGERRSQLERLRGDLAREGVETADLDRVVERLRALESGGELAGPETLAVLERDVVQGLREFEYGLRRSLGAGDEGRLVEIEDGDVPDGYEEMVEAYYKALAGAERSP
jgi:hypothetical protein